MILVIGGTGTTGRLVAAKLAERGHPTRIASRRPSAGGVRFDWRDPTTHSDALGGVHAIYAIPPVGEVDPAPATPPFLELGAAAPVPAGWFCSAPRPSRPPSTGWAWCTHGWVSCSGMGGAAGRPGSWRTSWVSSRMRRAPAIMARSSAPPAPPGSASSILPNRRGGGAGSHRPDAAQHRPHHHRTRGAELRRCRRRPHRGPRPAGPAPCDEAAELAERHRRTAYRRTSPASSRAWTRRSRRARRTGRRRPSRM